MRQLAFLASALALVAGGSRVLADAKNPTFDDDVLPIFKQHCTNCHGNDKQKGDLNLATYAALQKGGSAGAVVKPLAGKDNIAFAVNVARASRYPSLEELYYFGPHPGSLV